MSTIIEAIGQSGEILFREKSSDKIQRCAWNRNISLGEQQIFQLFEKARKPRFENSPHFAPGSLPGFVDQCHQLTRPLSFDAAVRAKCGCTLAAPSFTVKVFFLKLNTCIYFLRFSTCKGKCWPKMIADPVTFADVVKSFGFEAQLRYTYGNLCRMRYRYYPYCSYYREDRNAKGRIHRGSLVSACESRCRSSRS